MQALSIIEYILDGVALLMEFFKISQGFYHALTHSTVLKDPLTFLLVQKSPVYKSTPLSDISCHKVKRQVITNFLLIIYYLGEDIFKINAGCKRAPATSGILIKVVTFLKMSAP